MDAIEPAGPGLSKKKEIWILLIALLLLAAFPYLQQGGSKLTGLAISSFVTTDEQVLPLIGVEQPNASTTNAVTGAVVMDSPAAAFHYTDDYPSHLTISNAHPSDNVGTLLFDGKSEKYLYTSPFNIPGFTRLSLSFLTREDFSYSSSEFVTATLLFYTPQGELFQTQTLSYDQNEIAAHESATGITILSAIHIPEGNGRKIMIDVSLSPNFGASSFRLMFQPDSSVASSPERHVFIDGVTASGS